MRADNELSNLTSLSFSKSPVLEYATDARIMNYYIPHKDRKYDALMIKKQAYLGNVTFDKAPV